MKGTGGEKMESEENVEAKMMNRLIGAYGEADESMSRFIEKAVAMDKVAVQAICRLTELSDDPDEVLRFNRQLTEARRDLAVGAVDLIVYMEGIEDVIDDCIDAEIYCDDDEEDVPEPEGDERTVEGTRRFWTALWDNDSNVPPVPPERPEPGHENDPEVQAERIRFLTECVASVVQANLSLALVVNELNSRVGIIDEALDEAGMGTVKGEENRCPDTLSI